MTRDSAWLEHGQERCEGCGGSGAWLEGTCPACLGWGAAPPDPFSAAHPAGTICRACGRPATAGDPVVSAERIHRSHAVEQTAGYRRALAVMRGARS